MFTDIDPIAGPDGGDEGHRLAEFWITQLGKIKDAPQYKRWIKRGQTIEKRYRDERNRVDEEGQRRYNSLWSNVQILLPAIYARCPQPVAERRFRDKDPIARGAAQILERALRNEVEINNFNEAISEAVQDYLLPGRGTVWVRYEPEVEEGFSVVTEGNLDLTDNEGEIEAETTVDDETGRVREHLQEEESPDGEAEAPADEEEDKLRKTGDRIVRESVPIDYINWEDYFTFPHNARVWKEVTAVGKRVYMTRDQMIRRFGRKIGKDVPLKKDDRGAGKYDGPDMSPQDKGEVFEIWSLPTREVFWIAEGCTYLLDRKDDPLQLENFFPCPRPLYSNSTTGTLFPVPDYIEYQDQAIQIDELTQRISMLSKACKVAGVYNAAAKDIQRLLQESVENELIPVDDWAAFAEQGGVAGNISLLPLKEIIGVLNELMQIKDKCILEMDRLTGITDIMRGTTDARETLGGQRLKTNSAGTRLQHRQAEVARFCRDTVRIIADVMAQHFSDLSLIEASGAIYEEGLGAIDILPSMQAAQGMPPMMGHNGGPPMIPPQPQPGLLPQGTPPLGAVPSGMPPQGPMGAPQGNNVIPFPGAGPMQPQMDPQMMKTMIGLKRIMAAIGLIRDEKLRGFRVDIEVDSTVYGDSEQEKQDRTQFLTAITGYLQQALMMSQQVPEIAPLLGKFLQFGVRGFKVGRDLESSIEDFCDEAINIAKQKQAQAAQAAQNDPRRMQAQASMIKATSGAKASEEKSQNEKLKVAADIQEGREESQSRMVESQAEIQRQAIENQGEQQNNMMDMRMKEMDMQMKQMSMDIERLRLMTQTMKASRESMQPMREIAKGE